MKQLSERRKNRSNTRFRAAELYLDHLVRRGGPRALVLSDELGVVVGSAPYRCDLESLHVAGQARGEQRRADVSTLAMTIGGRNHVLTSLGSPIRSDRVRTDLARILRTG